MPIPRYQLDDRNFDDLVQEMLSRIPAHVPEWTNPQVGDPGHTLIDLFAWLADTMLYRVNLIPERQRLEFLRLLNIPMQPALAASGLVTLQITGNNSEKAVNIPKYTAVKGPAVFETNDEVTVFPITGKVFVKRRPTDEEKNRFSAIMHELEDIYDIEKSDPYVTTSLFDEIPMDPSGLDIARDTIDQGVWIALFAASDDENQIARVLESFRGDEYGEKVISIGFEPRLTIPEFGEQINQPLDMRELWQWEMPSARKNTSDNLYEIPYLTLDLKEDTTCGFTRRGLIKLALPSPDRIALPENSVDNNKHAGVGNLPPRIDQEEDARRLVAWIRLCPREHCQTMAIRWMGVNAVSIDQRKTVQNVIIAVSNGLADQSFRLPAGSIDTDTFKLQVEETGRGYTDWYNRMLHTAARDDRFYELDAEAGVIKFGDGLRGLIPEPGNRIRVQTMRYGGGRAGNIAAGNLKTISHPCIKLVQPIETTGGKDAETLEDAEKRIPGVLKHSHRAITEADYKQLALHTPGVELARVEVLPKFKPQQRIGGLVGVISVMVLPKALAQLPPNPRPDRNMLARVHAYLDERRPIGVELYVIGTEYVPLGLSVAVSLREGFSKNQVMQGIYKALREFLWPLTPGGHQGQGWQLGRPVVNHEIDVIVARVPGVLTVNDVNLFQMNESKQWEMVQELDAQSLFLEPWQLPELLTVVVMEDEDAPVSLDEYGSGAGAGGADEENIPIPVIPEICR
ncbi:MAG: putative baseplate assembly protein [Hyphomicrobiales bacterium]|nr:putative baseplate assembly protein [Hyphomicrobiales bacterium]